MIDFENIAETFQQVARNILDGQIANIPLTGGGTQPAVVRSRPVVDGKKGMKTNYPYVVFDFLSTTDTESQITNSFINDNDELVYEISKTLLVSFTVFGGKTQIVSNKLSTEIRFDKHRATLRTAGVALVDIDLTPSVPGSLADKPVEISVVTLTISTTDITVDTSTSNINTIVVDYELKESETDPNPIVDTFTVTNP